MRHGEQHTLKPAPAGTNRSARSLDTSSAISLAALALFLIVACGGEDTAETSTTASSGPTTTTSVTTTEVTLTDLTGTWDNGTFRLEVNDGGEYVLRPPDNPTGVLMGGFVARDGDRFSFVTSTSGECPGQTGTYTAAIDGDVLSLALVDDGCEERVTGFATPFERTG